MAIPVSHTISRAGSLLGILFALAASASAAPDNREEDLNQLKNLARINCGARIERISPGLTAGAILPGQDAATLVLDDDTLSCPLSVGEQTFIITLPRIAVLERFSFINQNAAAEGEFDLAVSSRKILPNDHAWVPVQTHQRLAGRRLVALRDLSVEAKYVRLSFHIQKEGRFGAMALYGGRTLDGFAGHYLLRARTEHRQGENELEETLNFNFANHYAHGRVVYVSSGRLEAAARMIDDDVSTSFQFGAGDPNPTAIIEIPRGQSLHRVTAVCPAQEGEAEVFLLKELARDPADLSAAKPAASVVIRLADDKVAVDFSPCDAHYVALRWHPTRSPKSFELAEIGAFGTTSFAVFDTEQFTAAFAESAQQGTNITSETLAAPPMLAVVSP